MKKKYIFSLIVLVFVACLGYWLQKGQLIYLKNQDIAVSETFASNQPSNGSGSDPNKKIQGNKNITKTILKFKDSHEFEQYSAEHFLNGEKTPKVPRFMYDGAYSMARHFINLYFGDSTQTEYKQNLNNYTAGKAIEKIRDLPEGFNLKENSKAGISNKDSGLFDFHEHKALVVNVFRYNQSYIDWQASGKPRLKEIYAEPWLIEFAQEKDGTIRITDFHINEDAGKEVESIKRTTEEDMKWVQFSFKPNSHEKEAIEKAFEKEVEKIRKIRRENVDLDYSAALADVSGDGTQDIIVALHNIDFTGANFNSHLYVISSTDAFPKVDLGTTNLVLDDDNIKQENLAIINNGSSSWKDLLISNRKWIWNGKKYEPLNV